jgi:hypothetical protein
MLIEFTIPVMAVAQTAVAAHQVVMSLSRVGCDLQDTSPRLRGEEEVAVPLNLNSSH